jgi:hypothetical protein
VPKNPYGIFGIVPDYLGLGALADRADKMRLFTNDHHVAFTGDDALSVAESVSAIKKALAECQQEVPFCTPDAFCGVQRLRENHWRLVLVDPGHLRQLGVKTTVRAAPSFVINSVVDRITGERLEHSPREIPVEIDRGLFRILDVLTKE